MVRVKGERPTFILVGNKCDKSSEREVLKEEGMRYAQNLGCEFMETSARTAHNVERLFCSLVRTLRNNRDGQAPELVSPSATTITEQPLKPKKKRPGCVIV